NGGMQIMFCPNCGHKVDPDQKFCDNCGWALKKKNTDVSTEKKDDDTIRSLSEIENELNAEEPTHTETPKPKPTLQQAPDQKREYGSFDHPTETHKEPEPEVKTYHRPAAQQTRPSSFEKSSKDEPLDDRTQVYNKNDFNPISQKPYKKSFEESTPKEKPKSFNNTFHDPIKDPIKDPFQPTESERRAAEAKRKAEEVDPNDGFI